MPKCDLNKVALQLYCKSLRHGCSPDLLHIFGTPFTENTSRLLLLYFEQIDWKTSSSWRK